MPRAERLATQQHHRRRLLGPYSGIAHAEDEQLAGFVDAPVMLHAAAHDIGRTLAMLARQFDFGALLQLRMADKTAANASSRRCAIRKPTRRSTAPRHRIA